MSEINYRDIDNFIKDLPDDVSTYLIYGDNFLYKKVYKKLIKKLLPDAESSINYEIINSAESIYQTIESLNTIPFLEGKKIIALKDSNIFYSKDNTKKLLSKSVETFSKDKNKGAKFFATLLGILDISKDNFHKKKAKFFKGNEEKIEPIFEYITNNSINIIPKEDKAKILQEEIEKGFANNSILIITTDLADKRQGLFKTIKSKGVVINCSTPKGFLAVAKKDQVDMLRVISKEILQKEKTSMDAIAFDTMYKLIGFNIERFSKEMEKLASYTKDKKKIEKKDVLKLVKRTKEDPIYEISNAIAERDVFKALFFNNSLIASGIFPLQILSAISNQIKKLFLIKTFFKNSKDISESIGYNDFKNFVLSKIIKYDEENFKMDEKEFPTLFIAKNKNPYPVYLGIQKAKNFSYEELKCFLNDISNYDMILKSSTQSSQTVIENLIIKICTK